jgi:hypothetical protein
MRRGTMERERLEVRSEIFNLKKYKINKSHSPINPEICL